MIITGEERVKARRPVVWSGLSDPDVLQRCIRGCKRVTRTGEDVLEIVVQAKIGPFKADFVGMMHILDQDEPQHCRIQGEGRGGLAGSLSGEALVQLEEIGDETLLTYSVEVHLGGKMASIGSRFIDSSASAFTEQFFKIFASVVSGNEPDASGEITHG